MALTLILFLVAMFIFFPSFSKAQAALRFFRRERFGLQEADDLRFEILFRPAGRLGGGAFYVRLVKRTKEGQGLDTLFVTVRPSP